ncbi:MAG: hypothetical protein JNL11_10215 [Bdellovibrionaceae bacterium]|nr:hypothetical protein [Pseudobdellovibrionaceae bacterium]
MSNFLTIAKLFSAIFVFIFLEQSVALDKCQDANLDRYIWVNTQYSYNPSEFTQDQKIELANSIYLKRRNDPRLAAAFYNNGAWQSSLVPLVQAQSDSVDDAIKYLGSDKLKSRSDVIQYLEDRIGFPEIPYLGAMSKDMKKSFGEAPPLDMILTLPQKEDYISGLKNTAAISAMCAQVSLMDVISCTRAVKLVLEEARFSGNNIIYPKIWFDSVRNEKFRAGLKELALLMLQRETEISTSSNLYADTFASFKKVGLSNQEAEDFSWKTLALYGNGGPNTGMRLISYSLAPLEQQSLVSLSIIGTEISLIDYKNKLKGNHHYAFPPEISGSCLSPKPYHFWLNAFIARDLVQKGFSPDVASSASFIVAKLYQLNRQLNNTAKNVETILNKGPEHPTIKVIRMDLTLNSGGAIFGSSHGTTKMNLEDGYSYFYEKTKNYIPLSNEQVLSISNDKLSIAKKWDEFLQPNLILNFFKKIN